MVYFLWGKFIFEYPGPDSKLNTKKQFGLIIHPEACWTVSRVGSQFPILPSKIFSLSLG